MKKLLIIVLFVLLFTPIFAFAQLRDCQLKQTCPTFGFTAPTIPKENFVNLNVEPELPIGGTVPVNQMTLEQIQEQLIILMQQIVNLYAKLIALL